jgi:hypothetical protein
LFFSVSPAAGVPPCSCRSLGLVALLFPRQDEPATAAFDLFHITRIAEAEHDLKDLEIVKSKPAHQPFK